MDSYAYKEWCKMVGLDVKPHQVKGLSWCLKQENAQKNKGGIICDEMGLGKTIIMLACIVMNPKKRTLIVVPPALLNQWVGCIQKFLGHTAYVYHGAEAKKATLETLNEHSIVLTTYGMISTRKKPLDYKSLLWGHNILWDRLICDEAHHMRNIKTGICKGAFKLLAHIRWMVTGTPIQNKKSDLRVLFSLTGIIANTEKKFHEVIRSKILRRTKENVGIKMPPLQTEIVEVEWESDVEKNLAASIHNSLPIFGVHVTRENVNDIMEFMDYESPLPLFVRARQVCIHPQLLVNVINTMKRNNIIPTSFTIKKIPTASKINAVVRKIHSESKKTRKIVFCHYRGEIDAIKEKLESLDYNVGVYDGRASKKQKDGLCQNDENAPDVLIAQIKSASEGLNLQHFTQIYFTSPHWNPAIEDQAVARAHRIGQKNGVKVFRFIMKEFEDNGKTIDNFCMEIQKTKRELMQLIECEK